MQDIHGIYSGGANTGGGSHGGPIFSDRRIRSAANTHHQQQALKCPRCNSSNTKFCYYNNYNLSQPRHFCKNCRRYWTNGGVLRNVPVGGGNRKSKRSSKRKALSPPPPRTAATNSNSRSSSESTSAKAQSTSGFAEESVTGSGSKFTDQLPVTVTTTFDTMQAMNSNFESLNDSGGIANSGAGGSIFTEIGGFVSFMSGEHNENLFGFGSGGHVDPTPFRIHQQNPVNHHQQHDNSQLMRNPTGPGMFDQTVHVDLHQSSRSSGGGVFGRGDWESVSGSVGDGRGPINNLFDLAPGSSGAHGGQWSQSDDQWHESEHDHHLYLPP